MDCCPWSLSLSLNCLAVNKPQTWHVVKQCCRTWAIWNGKNGKRAGLFQPVVVMDIKWSTMRCIWMKSQTYNVSSISFIHTDTSLWLESAADEKSHDVRSKCQQGSVASLGVQSVWLQQCDVSVTPCHQSGLGSFNQWWNVTLTQVLYLCTILRYLD